MALMPRVEVRQGLGLTLTPQLMQSIRLLQLSHLELNTFVEAELLRNPLSSARMAPSPATPTRRNSPSGWPSSIRPRIRWISAILIRVRRLDRQRL